MILEEALIGGTVYLEHSETEMALPENERVAFEYRALTNKEKASLLYRTCQGKAFPDGLEVCQLAVTKIKNLVKPDGTKLDTMSKLLDYPDKDNQIAYMIWLMGMQIWNRQAGEGIELKNSR